MGQPPSPATTMLNDSYDRMKGQMILKTQAESHMMLVTDSWTNIRGEAIVNYVLVTPNGDAAFHSADPTGAESHTGSYLSKRIIEVIEDTLHPMSRMPSKSSPLNILTCSESDVHHISPILQSRISLALILYSQVYS
ncbi:hypothetical protein V1506DRAFT_548110 [Lipomyces tetrasporus]